MRQPLPAKIKIMIPYFNGQFIGIPKFLEDFKLYYNLKDLNL